jgi:hypothetical protein
MVFGCHGDVLDLLLQGDAAAHRLRIFLLPLLAILGDAGQRPREIA